jgi:hypothetical protein
MAIALSLPATYLPVHTHLPGIPLVCVCTASYELAAGTSAHGSSRTARLIAPATLTHPAHTARTPHACTPHPAQAASTQGSASSRCQATAPSSSAPRCAPLDFGWGHCMRAMQQRFLPHAPGLRLRHACRRQTEPSARQPGACILWCQVQTTFPGALLRTRQELETAVRMGLNLTHIVWVDGSLNMVKVGARGETIKGHRQWRAPPRRTCAGFHRASGGAEAAKQGPAPPKGRPAQSGCRPRTLTALPPHPHFVLAPHQPTLHCTAAHGSRAPPA